MQYLEYTVIAAGLFFGLTFLWLLNVVGFLDYLKSGAQIKSASNCLTFIISQSDKVLAESRRERRKLSTNQNTQSQAASGTTSNKLQPYTL